MNESQHRADRTQISGERQTMYYLGLVLTIIGFLVFISIFVSAASSMGDPMMGLGLDPGSMLLRGVIGIGLIIAGSVVRSVGARGAAGAGVVLDPQQARRDLEPWSRMAGGMLQDAVDESGLRAENSAAADELPFDEKLRRLEKLRQDGLLSDAEYQQKRSAILNKDW